MDSTRARLHFLKRVFGSRSTAGRVATPQDLSVTKQHRNDRWDRCTASAGDWQIITTTSHRSANQRYFMHNGTYSQSFAPNCLRGEQIGALFNSHSFCTVVVDVESLEDLCGREKRQLCSVIAFGSSLGAPQKRMHANLSWSPQEQRVFEETFTD